MFRLAGVPFYCWCLPELYTFDPIELEHFGSAFSFFLLIIAQTQNTKPKRGTDIMMPIDAPKDHLGFNSCYDRMDSLALCKR